MKLEERLEEILKAAVKNGEAAGISVLVRKNGKDAAYAAYGCADAAAGKKVERDTIFRMYSQTKPVTAVALTMLIDRGLLDAGDPVEKLIVHDYMDIVKNPFYTHYIELKL